MDAHNCYPYDGWWSDRIDRALSAGRPLAIEQDLAWYTDPKTGRSWSVVAHGAPFSGQEPTMEHYFFDRVRPIVEKALKEGDHGNWPLITLNLDVKDNNPQHIEAVWKLLEKYQGWLTTARKSANPAEVTPLTVRPILVLTGEQDAQEKIFYDKVPVGGKLLLFGAVHSHDANPMAPPSVIDPEPASNYRRWWNNPWRVVEKGGQNHAGAWTGADDAHLSALVKHAHENHLWIRFYTLDGETVPQESCGGWFHGYNFGSPAAAEVRWRAAQQAGVDYIASDQYEKLAAFLRRTK
jgi:glycerophosphoryl diester phosphodiesterase